ncbi:MAG: hypothetical protein ACJAZP_000090 [Psychromonas sp.]|jgi:hypothetical protein
MAIIENRCYRKMKLYKQNKAVLEAGITDEHLVEGG